MKAHIGVDVWTGLAHSLTTSAANEDALNQTKNLLHGDAFIFSDAGYRGAEKWDALKYIDVAWHIATVKKSKGLEETSRDQHRCD